MKKILNRSRENHQSTKSHPPRKALNFLLGFMDLEERENFEEYAASVYGEIILAKGRKSARAWFWSQFTRSLPRLVIKSFKGDISMFKNYMKIALRNIKRYKTFSLINITGLAIGITCCLLITLWICDELSFDNIHKEVDNIYQVLVHGSQRNNPSTPAPLAPALKEEIPEITEATRYGDLFEIVLTHENKSFYENGIKAVDPSFFKIFSFPFLKGDPNTALDNIHSIVISETIAEKYFSGEDPIGKALTMNHQHDFIISGVIKSIPHNSTLQFDMLVPSELLITNSIWELNWDSYYPNNTFIKLQDNCAVDDINRKIADFIKKRVEGEDAIISILPFTQRNLFFSDIEQYIYIFSAIALFILAIACINFMNLSTARSVKRAKEIGVRKVIGARRRNIAIQFLGESFILSFIALTFAILLVGFLRPAFNTLTGKELSIVVSRSHFILPLIIGLTLFTGFAAGAYPALFLSAFRPVSVLQGNLKLGTKRSKLRKAFIVFQFSLSIFLIIATGVIYKQLDYIKDKDIGYEKEHIVNIAMRGDSQKFYDILKSQLLDDKRIEGVTGMATALPYFWRSSGTAEWDGKDPNKEILISNNFIDYDFIETLKIEMVEGRSFSRDFISDTETNYLVNEEMVKIMGLKSAVGAGLTYWGKTGKIIGVMKNFNFQPLNNQISPLVFMLRPDRVRNILIRIRPGNISSSIEFIKKTWNKTLSIYPFEYSFLDDNLNKRYRNIEKAGNLVDFFAALAVFVACLGLFGLATFLAEQRSKEIGIRKVLGAPVSGIVYKFLQEFTKCVWIANIIAWPVAYFAMNKWLQNFAYRTDLGIWTFLLSGLIAFLTAVITISFPSIKAATANPVDSLRYE